VQTLDDAESTIAGMQEFYLGMRLTLQPLTFLVNSTGNVVVAYNAYRWSFDTSVKAVDVCFKLIHVCCFMTFSTGVVMHK
jgi:hypothetical protein